MDDMYNEKPPKDDEFALLRKEERFKPKKPCNSRIDELAKPNKRLMLAMLESFGHHFTPERREAIKLLVQELFAMTPEETAKYFDEVNTVLKKMAARKKLKEKLQKKYKQRVWRSERQKAYHKLGKLLQKAMLYASKHSVPPFVSPRLRNMADVILEQLSDIRGIEMPDRSDPDKQSQFLVNISDWLAVAIEHIYYEIQVQKNMELDLIEAQIKAAEEAQKKSNKKSKKLSKPSSKKTGSISPDAAPSA